MLGSASHEACSEAGASLRYEELDGGSEDDRGVADGGPMVDDQGCVAVDGVRDRSWRPWPRFVKTRPEGLVRMSREGGSDHLRAGREESWWCTSWRTSDAWLCLT